MQQSLNCRAFTAMGILDRPWVVRKALQDRRHRHHRKVAMSLSRPTAAEHPGAETSGRRLPGAERRGAQDLLDLGDGVVQHGVLSAARSAANVVRNHLRRSR
jgi:hypothetical protein